METRRVNDERKQMLILKVNVNMETRGRVFSRINYMYSYILNAIILLLVIVLIHSSTARVTRRVMTMGTDAAVDRVVSIRPTVTQRGTG
jgi:short subunit dehydrogenase-like uncharacterized protein